MRINLYDTPDLLSLRCRRINLNDTQDLISLRFTRINLYKISLRNMRINPCDTVYTSTTIFKLYENKYLKCTRTI